MWLASAGRLVEARQPHEQHRVRGTLPRLLTVVVRLDEHASKRLLAKYGVRIPKGGLARSASDATRLVREVGTPAFIKGLSVSTSRLGRGGVRRVSAVDEAAADFRHATRALSVMSARVEEGIEDGPLFLVSVGLFPGDKVPGVMFSAAGGSDVESRSETIRRVSVDQELGLRPFHIAALANWTNLGLQYKEPVQRTVASMLRLAREYDALLVEVNPLRIIDGEAIALDCRIVLDDYAQFRRPRLPSGNRRSTDRSVAADLRLKGIDFVPLDGKIGIVGLGAGLTMQLADWVQEAGGTPAYFFDATVAAVRDWSAIFEGRVPTLFADSLTYGLQRAPNADVLLANFTSGGTPVDALTRGLLNALHQVDWLKPIVIHVAGNRSHEALNILAGEGIPAAPTLGRAVDAAVRAEQMMKVIE